MVKTCCTADFSSVQIFHGVNADDAILYNCNQDGRTERNSNALTEEKSAVQWVGLNTGLDHGLEYGLDFSFNGHCSSNEILFNH